MGARGSDRLVDAVEELLAEVPARLRGSRTRLSSPSSISSPATTSTSWSSGSRNSSTGCG
jgi:hypothetical protein